MAKKSRTKARDRATEGEVGPREACPCGSGKRYKACHGSVGGAYVARPFAGLAAERDLVALQRMQKLAPRLPLVMLIDKARHWPVLKPMVEPGWMLGPGIDALTKHPRFAAKMTESGRDVHVWTVNTEEQFELCRSLGVSAVITDRPAAVLGWLEAARTA